MYSIAGALSIVWTICFWILLRRLPTLDTIDRVQVLVSHVETLFASRDVFDVFLYRARKCVGRIGLERPHLDLLLAELARDFPHIIVDVTERKLG